MEVNLLMSRYQLRGACSSHEERFAQLAHQVLLADAASVSLAHLHETADVLLDIGVHRNDAGTATATASCFSSWSNLADDELRYGCLPPHSQQNGPISKENDHTSGEAGKITTHSSWPLPLL
jgi:hypothetical protein